MRVRRPVLPAPRRVLLSTLAGVVGTAGLLPLTAAPAHAAVIAGLTGDGSEGDPFVIATAADLDAVAAAINGDGSTYGGLAYRLDADIDYGGATFATIGAFSGDFDGDGHAISDIVYSPAADTVGLFRQLTDARVADLTLIGVKAVTATGAGNAAAVAARAMRSEITGTSVLRSEVTVAPVSATVNTQAGGLVGYADGSSTISDNLLWDVDVTGRKYAAGVVTYPRPGSVVADNLVVDVDVVADSPGAGSIAAMIVGQLATDTPAGGVDVGGNVVLRGSASGASARTFSAGMAGMTGTSPNLVSTTTTFKPSGAAYPGEMGTPATPEELAAVATYDGLGWDLAEGGAWRWPDSLRNPVPAAAALPSYALAYDLDGGTVTGNPESYLFGAETTLVNPTRDSFEFGGWTGTDLTAPTLSVTIPAGAAGDRSYTATWTTSSTYAISYDLAGGTAEGNPTTYTDESDAFTLVNPTREGHDFAGWTGTGLDGPTMSVTIPADATGDRSYVATWTVPPVSIPGIDGHGTEAEPFLVGDADDLDAVAAAINGDAATYGGMTYELTADIDYDGESFPGIATFTGEFDGAGHAISDLVYDPAADTVAFIRTMTGGEVTDVTFADVTATTATGAGSAAVVAANATDSLVSGVTVLSSTVQVAAVGATVNTAAAGLVGGAFGATRLTDNAVWDVDVTGRKYAAALVTYPRTGVTVEDNLVVDVDVVAGSSGAGSIAAMLIAQAQTGVDVASNAVVRGSASGVAATKALGLATMSSSAPNLVTTTTSFAGGTVAGAMGTPATPEELATEATYAGLGWDLTGAWEWVQPLGHPVPAAAQLPSYALTYDLAGGTGATNPASYTLGDPALTLTNPTREGYVFTGWATPGQSTPTVNVTIPAGATGDRSYTATWTPTEYAVAYDLGGGSASGNPASYTVESEAFTLTNPTREGYTFAGWTGTGLTGPTMSVSVPAGVTGDRSYVATWSAPTGFAVTYDLAGGSASGNPASYTVESETFTLTNPTREGYTFAGWTGTGLTGATTSVTVPAGSTGARAYAASWTAIDYPVTYDVAGGRIADGNRASYTVETGAFALVNPTREGYTFAGWTGTGLSGRTVTVSVPAGSTGARAYTATWTPISYRISYDLGGGDATNPVAYGIESGPITLAAPTRAGHRFLGWVGTGLSLPTLAVSIASGSTGDRSYVAIWEAVTVERARTTLKVAVADRARQQLRLTLAGGSAPTGKVTITATTKVKVRAKSGKARTKVVIKRQTVRVDDPTTTIRLRGLRAGTWTITARYTGDDSHQPTSAKPVKLRIAKAGK